LKARQSSERLTQFRAFCEHSEILPLTVGIAEIASTIHAELRLRGETIDQADILIAATAISCDCALVTNNAKHFQRIVGITLENWAE
jgi:tRNA(fMet)-specific endonuclease VapC